MATPHISGCILMCDGCGARFNDGERFASPVEARGAGYGEGWKFPPLLTKASAASRDCSDVCPACAPTWTPRQRGEKRPAYVSADGSVTR